MQGTSLQFATMVRSRVDAVGLVPDCAAAFSTYADVPGFIVSSGLKIMLFCLLHKSKKCSLIFHIARWERTGLRLRR